VIYKVFDVVHGSANFLISPTGKTELCDLGARADWSPLDHICRYYIPYGQRLDRLVLTHHHGDHITDV
jgi:glyoxylase-like metal-dependent hydrolase (beta-lactamase superfamily II)